MPVEMTGLASMRPGQLPRKKRDPVNFNFGMFNASMRPGQLPRKKLLPKTLWRPRYVLRFNEAGAIAPEKTHHRRTGLRGGRCFNEAGAIAPEKTGPTCRRRRRRLGASMRPGQLPRKKHYDSDLAKLAKSKLQ